MDDQYFVNNVVRIDAKFKDKENLKISTGFPLSPSLIATAKHAFYDEDFGKAVTAIALPSTRNEETGELEFGDAVHVKEIAFEFESDIDFLVLRLTKDLKLDGYKQVISSSKVSKNESWSTWGFPLVGDKYGKKHSSSGSIKPPDYSDKYIHLTNDDNALEKNNWKGLSGAPIIVNDWLCGIMVDKSPLEDARFRAISFYWLMKNKAFSDFYHKDIFPLSEEQVKAARVVSLQLRRILKKQTGLLNEISEFRSLESGCVEDSVVDFLIETPTLDVLNIFDVLLKNYFKEGEEKKWLRLVEDAIEIAHWLLLMTVNPEWLADNNMRFGVYEGCADNIKLARPAYGEFVISRWLLNVRQVDLDDTHSVCAAKKYQGSSLFSGVSKAAAEEELIIPLYKDLHKLSDSDAINLSIDTMCNEIVSGVQAKTRQSEGIAAHMQKPVALCYLLPEEELKKVKNTSWFVTLEKNLKGRLVFVGYSECKESKASSADQGELLALLGELMIMKKDKRP